jgi:hypothetical protein
MVLFLKRLLRPLKASHLKSWAMKITKRAGPKKAKVAPDLPERPWQPTELLLGTEQN